MHQPKAIPSLTVLMPVYNAGAFLREAVESILCQDYADFEMLAINDGSTDGSGVLLDEMARRDQRITVAHQQNRGLVETLNRGFHLARAPLVARMDADDIAAPGRLGKQMAFMEEHPETGLLGGAFEIFSSTGVVVQRVEHPCSNAKIQSTLLNYCCMGHPTVLVRRDLVLQAGGYRKVFQGCEDYDLWLRLAEKTVLANLPDVLLQYRCHSRQTSISNLWQQAACALAAKAAARIRRSTGADPLANTGEITERELALMGVSRRQIGAAVADESLSSARLLSAVGDTESSQKVIEAALNLSKRLNIPRKQQAILSLCWSGAQRRDGARKESFHWLLRAFALKPSLLVDFQRRKYQRWFHLLDSECGACGPAARSSQA